MSIASALIEILLAVPPALRVTAPLSPPPVKPAPAITSLISPAGGVRGLCHLNGKLVGTTLGTIGTGTWQGTAIANTYLGTGINANKIANGSVTSTEFQYINSLSSNAQTQLDSKPNKSFVTAIAVALG